MQFFARTRPWPRRRAGLIVGVAVAVAGGLTAALIAVLTSTPPSSGSGSAPTDKPAPAPTIHVSATFEGWGVVSDADSPFEAEYGTAPEGATSLRVTSSDEASPAIQQLVAVQPLTKYVFSALVAKDGKAASTSGLALRMGSTDIQQFDFEAESATWTKATWTHTTLENETELPLALVATGPVSGFRIDGLTMVKSGGEGNLIANGSFETFSAPTQITNQSLVMQSGNALLGLAWRTPSVTWSVADEYGTAVLDGELPIENGLGVLFLNELSQGYYSASLTSSDDAIAPQQISLLVLDDPTPPSDTDDRFGVGLHIGAPAYKGSDVTAARLGFRHARNDAYWSRSELERGVYQFPAAVDLETDAFKNAGVAVLPLSVYANKLYDDGRTPSSESGIGAYAAFTSAVVDHFSPDAVEVYNEFNWNLNTSSCGKSAGCYLQLLKPTADRVRSEHPGTMIVGPSTAHMDDAFMTEFYQNGGLSYVDAVSFHPYDELNVGAEMLLPILKQTNERIKEYNDGNGKPIWLTEMGWTSGKVGELNQANYLVRGQTIAFANGVERFYWYDLVNDNLDLTDGEGNFGLLRQVSATVPAFAPKPAAMAQAMLARKLADKPFQAQDILNGTTFSYAFGEGDSATRVAWATSPTTVTFESDSPVTVTTQYGKTAVLKPTTGRISIGLTEQAVYLDGALANAEIVVP